MELDKEWSYKLSGQASVKGREAWAVASIPYMALPWHGSHEGRAADRMADRTDD